MNGDKPKLAELHSHLGAAVQPHILWSIAHDQGIKLPTKDYWEFEERMAINRKGRYNSFWEINKDLYKLSELIQSSPLALEPAVHHTITGAYRNSNIVLHELRFCPAKRNRGGERDLDYIILAAIRGLEKALLEFSQVKAGLILMLDREFDYKLNSIMYEKAKKYQNRGIIGLDLAGPQRKGFRFEELIDVFVDAKQQGFGITFHTGEEGDIEEMRTIIKKVRPGRIGHGLMPARLNDKEILIKLVDNDIYLELCPTSNLYSGNIKDYKEMKKIYNTLYEHGVKLTINTDGPEFYNTNLQQELQSLIKNEVFNQEQIDGLIQNGFEASFIK